MYPPVYAVLARQSATSMTGVPQISSCSSPTVQHRRSVASSASLMKTERPARKASTCAEGGDHFEQLRCASFHSDDDHDAH